MYDDPLHPDLVLVGRSLQRRLDLVLEAEQEAARVVARRSATLRDRLVDAEDAEASVTVTLRTGEVTAGRVASVAVDHIELEGPGGSVLVMLDIIGSVRLS